MVMRNALGTLPPILFCRQPPRPLSAPFQVDFAPAEPHGDSEFLKRALLILLSPTVLSFFFFLYRAL